MTNCIVFPILKKSAQARILRRKRLEVHALPKSEKIMILVCEHFNIDKDTLFKVNRKREIIYPRQLAMYLMHLKANMSLCKIGKIFDKDHTTVIHSCNAIKDLMFAYPEIEREVYLILDKI